MYTDFLMKTCIVCCRLELQYFISSDWYLPTSNCFHPLSVYVLHNLKLLTLLRLIPVVVRSKTCWDCGFESRWGNRLLSLLSFVCYHVEVSASAWSLVRSIPSERGVSECEASIMRNSWPTRSCYVHRK